MAKLKGLQYDQFNGKGWFRPERGKARKYVTSYARIDNADYGFGPRLGLLLDMTTAEGIPTSWSMSNSNDIYEFFAQTGAKRLRDFKNRVIEIYRMVEIDRPGPAELTLGIGVNKNLLPRETDQS